VRAALLLLLAAVLLFPAAGRAPLERAEIYFVDAARAMVESGDWLVPRYRGEPFFDKPALTYWLIAAAFEGFGPTLAAARAVPALAALATILTTALLGRRLFGEARGLTAGLLLASTLAFTSFGRVAMSDMLLALWTAAAMALAAVREPPPLWRPVALGAVLGLGFLTKGPIALLLAGSGMLLLLARGGAAAWRGKPLAIPLGTAAFAVVGLGWFALLYERLGPQPLAHFFLRENLERFAGATYDSGRAPWFYAVTYLAEGLPWSCFLPLAIVRLVRERRRDEGAAARLLALWLALMAVPLSLARGKIDYYLLPVYPVAALIVADYLHASWSRAERAAARLVLLATALACVAAATWWGRLPPAWLPAPGVWRALQALAVLLAALLVAAALRFSQPRLVAALAGAAAATFLAGAAVAVPAFRAAQPNAAIIADVSRELQFQPEAGFVYCDDPTRVERDLLFEARIAAIERCDLWSPAASRLPFLLLLRKSERGGLLQLPEIRHVGEYRFVPATALTLTGLSAGVAADDLVLLANYWTADPEADSRFKRLRRRMIRERQQAGVRR
jgi:4-amino-4-deoxy-L-arabinose transferase-like glycosyltransferase